MSHYFQDFKCTLRNGMLCTRDCLRSIAATKKDDACTHIIQEVADAALWVVAFARSFSLSLSPNFGSFLPVYGSTVKREAEQRLQRTPSVCQEALYWRHCQPQNFSVILIKVSQVESVATWRKTGYFSACKRPENQGKESIILIQIRFRPVCMTNGCQKMQ